MLNKITLTQMDRLMKKISNLVEKVTKKTSVSMVN
jgi:hypothetical protein